MKHPMNKKYFPALVLCLSIATSTSAAEAASISDFFTSLKSKVFKTQATSQTAKEQYSSATIDHSIAEEVNTSAKMTIEEGESKTLKSIRSIVEKTTPTSPGGEILNVKSSLIISETQSEASRIQIEFTPTHIQVNLTLSEAAAKNPEMAITDILLVHSIVRGTYDNNFDIKVNNYTISRFVESNIRPANFNELLTNARMGSLTAQARLTEVKMTLLKEITLSGNLAGLDSARQQAIETLSQQLPQQVAAAQKMQRNQEKELARWRKETGALEKYEAMNAKLNDLILANDRSGVKKMIETYLPWAVMEPMEVQSWKTWLDAIENPSKDTVIAFRGLDYKTDKLQRTSDGRIGMLSTVLTANQGSYTRRLRSLSTNRIKNGDSQSTEATGTKVEGASSLNIVHSKIYDQFKAHSRDPKASSFLSFTYSPSVANRFSGGGVMETVDGKTVEKIKGGVVAVQVDRRRMVPNLVSSYTSEIELLAPLIIFPDEVIAFEEGQAPKNNGYKNLIETVKLKTGKDFSSWMNVKDEDLNLNQKFVKDGLDFMKNVSETTSNQNRVCQKLFL